MMNAYSSEVCPSRILDFAVEMCVFFSNFGSAISQYAFIYLRESKEFYPYYLTIFLLYYWRSNQLFASY